MLLAVGACLCVAGPIVTTKSLLEQAPVMPTLFIQVLTSTIALTLVAWTRGAMPRGREWRFGLPGLFQPGLTYILVFFGLQRIPVSLEGLLTASEAAIVAILAWPLIGERPTVRVVIAIVLSSAGIVMMTCAAAGTGMPAVGGFARVLAGVSLAALDTVLSRHFVVETSSLPMTAAVLWVGLCVVAVSLAIIGPYDFSFFRDPSTLIGVALSGIVLHGIALLLFNEALATLPATIVAALFPLISLLTAIGGVLFLGESLALLQWFGGGLIVVSSLIVVWCIDRRELHLQLPKP